MLFNRPNSQWGASWPLTPPPPMATPLRASKYTCTRTLKSRVIKYTSIRTFYCLRYVYTTHQAESSGKHVIRGKNRDHHWYVERGSFDGYRFRSGDVDRNGRTQLTTVAADT